MSGSRVRRASITDVARKAGVAVGTVSNVLNRPERVAPATRERVQAAITELRFLRNASARRLRAGSIPTIGAVVLDITNPFFVEVARGVEDRLAADDYTLMLASSDGDPEREARYLRLFESHGVAGVLVTPSGDDLSAVLEARDRGVDVVLLDATSPSLPSVGVDDVRGAALAVEHLLALGHRRIGFVNGPHTLRQAADRRTGALAALTAAGLPEDALVEVCVQPDATGGEAGLDALMDAPGPRPTAVLCINDLAAIGALRALRRRGLVVPDDVALVGYDDVLVAAELLVPLTSVRQPTHALGWRAADLLLSPPPGGPQRVLFDPELVVRASTAGRAPAAGWPAVKSFQ